MKTHTKKKGTIRESEGRIICCPNIHGAGLGEGWGEGSRAGSRYF